MFEKGPGIQASVVALRKSITFNHFGTGFTAFLFAATGPVAILLASAKQGHLSEATTISWLAVVFVTGGLGTLLLALYYRQPIMVAWSIPGAALAGDALQHYSFSDVLGAYLVLGVLLVVVGASGAVKWAMSWLPMPVLLGMVAGVLLPYGVAVFNALSDIPLIAYSTLAVFVFLTASRRYGRILPPVLCALVVALLVATLTNATNWAVLQVRPATPLFFLPTFNLSAILALVPPLFVAVLGIQNGQGIAILTSQNYTPPINTMTTTCGIVSLINVWLGGHAACIAGPTVAIVGGPAAGERSTRFIGAVVNSVLWTIFGLFAPVAVSLAQVVLAPALIPMLGGLAMLPVLTGVFSEAFSGKFRSGALFALLITLSSVKIAGIGSAFWGLVGGVIIAILLDRADFQELVERNRNLKIQVSAISRTSDKSISN